MSTSRQNVDPGAVHGEHERQDGPSGHKRIALAAAAIALSLIAALPIIQSHEEAPGTSQTPAAAQAPASTVTASAEAVATGFLDAFAAFDVKRAMTYLADDATIASLGGNDDLRLLVSYLEATGYRQILD